MEITVHNSISKLDKYFLFLTELYESQFGFDFFISDKKKAVEFISGNNYSTSFIEITNNKKCIAHISLIENTNLPKAIAFFGFFECIKDEGIFQLLWQKLISLAKEKGIEKLLGPVDGAIWFQYRIVSLFTNERRFNSEPLSQAFYYDFFRALNPTKENTYHSAFRRKFEAITQITKPSMENASNLGFKIEKITNPNKSLLEEIYKLSLKLFENNWGFTPISFDDFLKLYDSNKFSKHIRAIYTVTKDKELVGYCANIEYNNTLVIKTIGISQEYQGLGIGNALVFKVHQDAVNSKNIDKIIYALIKKENKIKYFPMDDIQIFREYASFEFEIS